MSADFFLDDYVTRAAEREPDALAVRFAGQGQSYKQLSQRAAVIADFLRQRGIGRGSLVAIHMHKALELPAIVYGILMAGAGYVPIDPNAPIERVRAIEAQCDLDALFVGAAQRKSLAVLHQIMANRPVIVVSNERPGMLDGHWIGDISNLSTHPQISNLGREPEDVAYVIFTSGSTGTPKGIVHTHRSACAYAEMAAALYDLGPDDRMANVTPLHFDMSTFEFFAGPARGAAIVLVPEPLAMMPVDLVEYLRQEQATTLYAVPFLLIQLSEIGQMETKDMGSLRWIIHAGEPMPPVALAKLQMQLPECRFSNSYGPAEVNQVTYHHYPAGSVGTSAALPIGLPCPGVDIIIEPGTGELLVAAPSMMAYYVGRAGHEEGIFTEHTTSNGQTATYYRTGDIFSRALDGTLMFHGRADRQIKIRGFRVELDEVELALVAQDGVAEAAAIVSRDKLTILGFIRASDGSKIDPPTIMRALRGRLPSYALPKKLHVLDDFPRTGTSKIDRKRLIGEFDGK